MQSPLSFLQCGALVVCVLTVPIPELEAQEISVWNSSTRVPKSFDSATLAPLPFDGPSPIDFVSTFLVARSAVDSLDAGLPQMSSDFSGITTVMIPGNGRLLHFRALDLGKSGILHVDGSGHARTLLDLPFFSGVDALVRMISVSAWDARAAVVTDSDLTGRGDVYLLRLDGQDFSHGAPNLLLTGAVPNVDGVPESMTFASGSLFFVDADHALYRAPVDGSQAAVKLSLPPSGGQSPAVIGEELQVSRDGSTVALLAGQNEKVWDLYVGDAAGSFRNLTQSPAEYQQVGNLPDPQGPYLALEESGGRVTYGDEQLETEYFTRATDGSNAPIHLTEDAFFTESIGDTTGVADFAGKVVIVTGEDPDTKDVYQFTLSTTAVQQVVNLTQTSGDQTTPFDKGAQLNPMCLARSGNQRIVVDDRSFKTGVPTFDLWTVGADGALLQSAGLPEMPQVRQGLNSPTRVAVLAAAAGQQLVRLPDDATQSMQVLLTAPAGVTLGSLAIAADGLKASLIAFAVPGNALLAVVDTATGFASIPVQVVADYGSQATWTAASELRFNFGFVGRRLALQIGIAGYKVLPGVIGTPFFF